jgi:hypothetical protein
VKIQLSDKPIIFHDKTVSPNYPIEIPFTEYSLNSSGCSWNNANFNLDSVYIINSEPELLTFISCMGDSTPPVFDFTQYSLLLVCGNTDYAFSKISKRLEQLSLHEYTLDIGIYLNDTTNADNTREWCLAIAVPKVIQNTMVALNVMLCESKISITNYSLDPANPWDYLDFHTLYVINSNEDLLTLFKVMPALPIDFTHNTLLCIRSGSPNLIAKMDTILLKDHCNDQYALNIVIYQSIFTQPQAWYIAILTPKIPDSAIILNHKNLYLPY